MFCSCDPMDPMYSVASHEHVHNSIHSPGMPKSPRIPSPFKRTHMWYTVCLRCFPMISAHCTSASHMSYPPTFGGNTCPQLWHRCKHKSHSSSCSSCSICIISGRGYWAGRVAVASLCFKAHPGTSMPFILVHPFLLTLRLDYYPSPRNAPPYTLHGVNDSGLAYATGTEVRSEFSSTDVTFSSEPHLIEL
ncbi:hypothetical protein K439DRAFT_554214 [Ramaria rubella]|nr:hypothetical protein K439DRAFT_554214 [Ramaria rubella]